MRCWNGSEWRWQAACSQGAPSTRKIAPSRRCFSRVPQGTSRSALGFWSGRAARAAGGSCRDRPPQTASSAGHSLELRSRQPRRNSDLDPLSAVDRLLNPVVNGRATPFDTLARPGQARPARTETVSDSGNPARRSWIPGLIARSGVASRSTNSNSGKSLYAVRRSGSCAVTSELRPPHVSTLSEQCPPAIECSQIIVVVENDSKPFREGLEVGPSDYPSVTKRSWSSIPGAGTRSRRPRRTLRRSDPWPGTRSSCPRRTPTARDRRRYRSRGR